MNNPKTLKRVSAAGETGQEEAPSFRVACFPGVLDDNLYQKLFYDALGETGLTVTGALVPDDRWLRDNVGQLDALHFHWPESLWRNRGNSWLGKLRGVVGLTRYLRLAAKLGIKRIWTMHNLDHHEGSNWVDRLGYRQLAKNSDLIICHSQHAKETLQKRDRPCAPIVVMSHGSYVGVYPSPRPRGEVLRSLGLDPDKPVVCCVGYLRPYKGFDTALRAVVKLKGEVQLIVAGKPGETFDSSSFEKVGVGQGVVKIFRRIDDQEFSDFVSASEAVLLPYRQITGSGALLAAWTLSRGVVVSDLPFFREVAASEPDAAAFAPVADADQLAEEIRNYLKISAEARSAAAGRLAGRYAWANCIVPVSAILNQWLQSKGATTSTTVSRDPALPGPKEKSDK